MAQLRIEEVLPSKSGKAWRVKSGGKWYGAFGDSGIEAHVGKLIEADITTSEKYGPGISKYKVIQAETPPKTAQNPPGASIAPYWLPMASNTVAHAISMGLIKTPDEIKVWVLATKQAVEGD